MMRIMAMRTKAAAMRQCRSKSPAGRRSRLIHRTPMLSRPRHYPLPRIVHRISESHPIQAIRFLSGWALKKRYC
jgi:hypothetical protein